MEDIQELIRKCLNLAKSPNEYEAALALGKAQELLEKYNLSLAEIGSTEIKTRVDLTQFIIPIGNSNWKRDLINVVAKNNFCREVILGPKIAVIGRGDNISAVLQMILWLMAQVENLAWLETTTATTSASKLTWRNSFLQGVIKRLDERLQEARRLRAVVNTSITALTLNLNTEVEDYVRKLYPNLRTHYRESHILGSAYNQGRVAGDQIGLVSPNRTVEGDRTAG
jgi:hypothetical protein